MSEINYQYRLISAPEIINHKRGVLNLGNVIPKVESRVGRRFSNREMITEFFNEMSDQGWEYQGQVLYEGLPNNGCLVFRKPLSKEQNEVKKDEATLSALATEFESLNSGNAIWRGKKTKAFKEFLRQKGYDFEEIDEE
jgi:hypothetical protein